MVDAWLSYSTSTVPGAVCFPFPIVIAGLDPAIQEMLEPPRSS